MNTTLIIRICVVTLALLVIALIGTFFKEAGDGTKLVMVIVLGLTGGLLAVKYVIPMLGDAMSEAVFSSGEKVEQDEMTKKCSRTSRMTRSQWLKLPRCMPNACAIHRQL